MSLKSSYPSKCLSNPTFSILISFSVIQDTIVFHMDNSAAAVPATKFILSQLIVE